MLGKIELANFEGLTKMPQEAASAWAEIEQLEMTGAVYKPLLYCGSQQVKGINHWFIAEQTLITKASERRLVKLAINAFDGKFTIIPHSLQVIDFEL